MLFGDPETYVGASSGWNRQHWDEAAAFQPNSATDLGAIQACLRAAIQVGLRFQARADEWRFRRRRTGPRDGHRRPRARRRRWADSRCSSAGAGKRHPRTRFDPAGASCLVPRTAASQSRACRNRIASAWWSTMACCTGCGPRRRADQLDRQISWAMPVRGGDEHDAGVHGAVAHAVAIGDADHDGAGAAIALGATFLGPTQLFYATQIFEDGQRWADVAQVPGRTAQKEAHRVPHWRWNRGLSLRCMIETDWSSIIPHRLLPLLAMLRAIQT